MKIKFANKPVVEEVKVVEPIEEMIKITKEELDSIIEEIEEDEELEGELEEELDEFKDGDGECLEDDYTDEDNHPHEEEITE